jgi:mRNA interferase MazF
MTPQRGEVWWAELPDKRRPVLVLTRNSAIPVLRTVIVAPLTTRVRGIPTEVALDTGDGLPAACAASLDNLTVTDRLFLVERQTTLSPVRMAAVCRALRLAVDC